MKIKNYFLLTMMLTVSNASNATDWDFGGYVPTSDSPVIGGFGINSFTQCSWAGLGNQQTCNTVRGIAAFGKIAYTGTLSGGVWYDGSFTNLSAAVSFTCPANTAAIDVGAPYIRADGPSFQPYVYSYPSPYYGKYPENVTLCVKTDTY